jgi:hypothetical protein
LAFVFIPCQAVRGQNDFLQDSPERWREPDLGRQIFLDGIYAAETNLIDRPSRFQLFRMPPGYLCEPVGLDAGDDPTLLLEATSPFHQSAPGEDRLQVVLGSDNPFFEFRPRRDPGGAGYYRLDYQYQLVDARKTGLCLNCRAVTPAGLESDGLAHGPTVVSPALAWFQELGDTTLHGFIGNHIRASSRWADSLELNTRYGVALARPIPGLATFPGTSFHWFVEALGQQRNTGEFSPRPASAWEVLPGVHWQGGQNWWMSGGLVFPVGASRQDSSLFQITCSWRF